jgi:hypothetical protein
VTSRSRWSCRGPTTGTGAPWLKLELTRRTGHTNTNAVPPSPVLFPRPPPTGAAYPMALPTFFVMTRIDAKQDELHAREAKLLQLLRGADLCLQLEDEPPQCMALVDTPPQVR